MSESVKLRLRVGVHEFEAEGAQAYVNAQFEAWKNLISGSAGTQPGPSNGQPVPPTQAHLGGAADDVLQLFDTSDSRLTLRACPTGDQAEGDAILLVAYGYRRIQNHESTLATQMAESLRLSGVPIARTDRAVGPLLAGGLLIGAGGRAKAKRYRLTTTGIQRAETLAKELVAKLG